MKNILLLIFICAISFNSSSQVVTGVYKGKMEVDSPKYTVDFELTLKEKDGKLYGYCHRLFIVNDILYYNLVKVTARIADSILIVEDEKTVSNNFEEKTKGVKTVMFFKIQKDEDTVSVMPGEWSTSRTKKFLPITGKISVTRERNYLATQLYKRLEDKKLDQDMAFAEPPKPQPAVVSAPVKTNPVEQSTTINTSKDSVQTVAKIGNEIKTQTNKPANANTQPKQKQASAPIVNKPIVTATTTDSVSVVVKGNETKTQVNKPSTNPNQTVAVNQNKPQTNQPATSKPTIQKQQPTINTVNTQTKPLTQKPTNTSSSPTNTSTIIVPDKPLIAINKVGQEKDSSTTGKPLVQALPPPVINNPVLTKRALEIIQALEISEDSVVFTLYDNGEIDGDTVSVFVNNELVVAKVGLKAQAYKQTIYIKPGEIIQLTLFAENLGSIPPNTGLLVIYTNNERYQINFSSTLNKSSSILLRRKQ